MDESKRRSSILKPQKNRNPLGDLDLGKTNDENKAPPLRRISFANSNFVKPFLEDEDKNTIWDTTYEEFVQHTDSSQEGGSNIQEKKKKVASKLNESIFYNDSVSLSSSNMDITPITINPTINDANSLNSHNTNFIMFNKDSYTVSSVLQTKESKTIQNIIFAPPDQGTGFISKELSSNSTESLIEIARRRRKILEQQEKVEKENAKIILHDNIKLNIPPIYFKDTKIICETTDQNKENQFTTLSSTNMDFTQIQPSCEQHYIDENVEEVSMEFTQRLPDKNILLGVVINNADETIVTGDMELTKLLHTSKQNIDCDKTAIEEDMELTRQINMTKNVCLVNKYELNNTCNSTEMEFTNTVPSQIQGANCNMITYGVNEVPMDITLDNSQSIGNSQEKSENDLNKFSAKLHNKHSLINTFVTVNKSCSSNTLAIEDDTTVINSPKEIIKDEIFTKQKKKQIETKIKKEDKNVQIPVSVKKTYGGIDMKMQLQNANQFVTNGSVNNKTIDLTNDTGKTDVIQSAKEDAWYNLSKYSNNDSLLSNVSLDKDDAKLIRALEMSQTDVFNTSRPSKSDFSKIMSGDYNPSFNSKIMNALSMSFNSEVLAPKFLNKTNLEDSVCQSSLINQDLCSLKDTIITGMSLDNETPPSLIEITDEPKRSVSSCTQKVNETNIDYTNMTFFKEIEDDETSNLKIDEEYEKKAEVLFEDCRNEIASLRKTSSTLKKRYLKDIENFASIVDEVESLSRTINSSCNTVNSSITVNKNVNSIDEVLSNTKPFLSINLGVNSSFCNTSIKEKVEDMALRGDGFWNIVSLEDDVYTFNTLYETLILRVNLDTTTGVVSAVEIINNMSDNSEPITKYICNAFTKKLKYSTIQSALGGEKFEIISLLEYIYVSMQKMLDICTEFENLAGDVRYLLKMDHNLRISFNILNEVLLIHWLITVDMSKPYNITTDSINIRALIGTVQETSIKRLISECPKGFPFVQCFIGKIEQYLSDLEKRKIKNKRCKNGSKQP